jgi:hypothetical protein
MKEAAELKAIAEQRRQFQLYDRDYDDESESDYGSNRSMSDSNFSRSSSSSSLITDNGLVKKNAELENEKLQLNVKIQEMERKIKELEAKIPTVSSTSTGTSTSAASSTGTTNTAVVPTVVPAVSSTVVPASSSQPTTINSQTGRKLVIAEGMVYELETTPQKGGETAYFFKETRPLKTGDFKTRLVKFENNNLFIENEDKTWAKFDQQLYNDLYTGEEDTVDNPHQTNLTKIVEAISNLVPKT